MALELAGVLYLLASGGEASDCLIQQVAIVAVVATAEVDEDVTETLIKVHYSLCLSSRSLLHVAMIFT